MVQRVNTHKTESRLKAADQILLGPLIPPCHDLCVELRPAVPIGELLLLHALMGHHVADTEHTPRPQQLVCVGYGFHDRRHPLSVVVEFMQYRDERHRIKPLPFREQVAQVHRAKRHVGHGGLRCPLLCERYKCRVEINADKLDVRQSTRHRYGDAAVGTPHIEHCGAVLREVLHDAELRLDRR